MPRPTIPALAVLLAAAVLSRGQSTAPSPDHTMDMPMPMHMPALLGPYPMTRESSGTSWQPDSTPMEGIHFHADDWSFMLHGQADIVYDHQSGPRGADKTFSPNMLMLMAEHPLGPGRFGLRTMLSLEPATIGTTGYPLLFQTGETANARTPLIDRQHPHDLFMELAATYALDLSDHSSAFVYLGYPGEPALGPTTFMHRFSGMDNPEAPITHHWLDSTHVTFGVLTAGYVFHNLKLEASLFTGRDPNQNRWDFDDPKFDSQSVRLTYNFAPNWSTQVSYGRLNSPEQLEPDVNQNRFTTSLTYNKPLTPTTNWQTTAAFGQDDNNPGHRTNAFLLESAINFNRTHTLFARYENVAKDELFIEPDPRAADVFTINKLSFGYIYDFPESHHVQLGLGALGSLYAIPDRLQHAYGNTPLSFMLFARLKF